MLIPCRCSSLSSHLAVRMVPVCAYQHSLPTAIVSDEKPRKSIKSQKAPGLGLSSFPCIPRGKVTFFLCIPRGAAKRGEDSAGTCTGDP
jgi:hypothetical protein